MPIDASIYNNLQTFKVPSVAEAEQNAMRLSNLGLQQQNLKQQMQTREQQMGVIDSQEDRAAKKAQFEDHQRKLSVLGNTLEPLAGMDEAQRAQMYPQARQSLIQSGVINPQDAPEQYDPGFFQQSLAQYRQTKEYMDRQKTMLGMDKTRAEIGKLKAQTKAERSKMASVGKPKQLPADKVLKVNEGNAIPEMLTSIDQTIENNLDMFGPAVGRARSANPWDERSQTIDAHMRAVSQAFGRYMEGGVLRKEDEEKYRKMFPNLSDTSGVAKGKLAIVKNLLTTKQNSDLKALKDAGYDTTGLDKGLSIADLPESLTKKQKSVYGFPIPEANASNNEAIASSEVTDQDRAALQWVQQNPNAPQAERIRQTLKSKGLMK